ncbi:CRISPR-associated endonuclease Cas3'' [Streptoalloteichus tenebrarius]|uniref:CRISPR-associated endonuclease Cas3'' n=1 Tax=Streptoalloteichus tenebrarius (strain ATCC 17920 / DSM 40477 / JCM 4838 / CBS 697.72 / NBRC 16177 / NCIMB 11028 / NRRL B-12390 / A12253. 1 / ISP 5477) TaxID=1933 RepID=UPI0035588134|nr:hypothetical protein GCM10020241_56110 [Streptoalloteichus tenebrarius]
MWAHSAEAGRPWHGLSEHLRSTAELARCFAEPFGAGDLGEALGLFHDAGKASPDRQSGLARVGGTDAPVGVSHKELGAWLLTSKADVAALAVLGHHGGLTSLTRLRALVRSGPQPTWCQRPSRFWTAPVVPGGGGGAVHHDHGAERGGVPGSAGLR